jgi:hypothetical protein
MLTCQGNKEKYCTDKKEEKYGKMTTDIEKCKGIFLDLGGKEGLMKKILILIVLTNLFMETLLFGHPTLLPKIIKDCKPSAIYVSAEDIGQVGSGVLMIVRDTIYVLTNEHVVALKDSNKKTIRYAKNIFIGVMDTSTNIVRQLPVEKYKVDEKLDLAALRPYARNSLEYRALDISTLRMLGISWCKDPAEIQEGETIIYMGYPWELGVGKQKLYPLSRQGIVAQLIPGENNFLIDAFVQEGYSGSPVFLIRQEKRKGKLGEDITGTYPYFIGIAKSYPSRYNAIYENVALKEKDSLRFKENPGFSEVIGTTVIKKFFGF